MKRLSLGMFSALLLIGCSSTGKQSDDIVTPGKFADWAYSVGWEKLPSDEWTARTILASEPPLNDSLINAIADPFATNATWAQPSSKGERDQLIEALEKWWAEATVKPNLDLTDEEVASRFGVAIGARVLQSRLIELNGDHSSAFDLANETVVLVYKSLDNAPDMWANEMFPSALIASENLARMSKSEKVSVESKKAALKSSVFGLPGLISGKVRRHYLTVETKELFSSLSKKDIGEELAIAVDPLDASPEMAAKFRDVVGTPPTRDFEGAAKSSYKTLDAIFNPRAGYGGLSRVLEGQSRKSIENWGVDVFTTPVENWDISVMKEAFKKSESAIGDTLTGGIVMKYLPSLDSAFLAQMQIDANRIRIASEIYRQEKNSYPVEFAQLDEYLKGSVIDTIAQRPYEIDFKTWTLRSSQESADKKFIFINQAISSGSKI